MTAGSREGSGTVGPAIGSACEGAGTPGDVDAIAAGDGVGVAVGVGAEGLELGATVSAGRALGSAECGAADADGESGDVNCHPAMSAPPRSPSTSVSATANAADDRGRTGSGSGRRAGRLAIGASPSDCSASSRMARATASARLEAPSRPNTLEMCQFTVLSEIPRSPAISLLVRPVATRARISRCRGLSCVIDPGTRQGRCRDRRQTRFSATSRRAVVTPPSYLCPRSSTCEERRF